jgi:hypothetical protein
MPKIVRHQLRAKQVEKLAAPGVYQDGGGLQLRVRDTGAKFWVLRVTAKGKRSDKGLGSFPNVSLEEARAKADAVRRAIKSGVPIPATKTEVGITFKEAFDICWRSKRQTLTNVKHRQQWESTMATYVFPKIGHTSVADIRAGEIVDVLRPIWATKPETARRILQRVEFVFRAAIRREWRDRASPTVGVREELGSMRKVAKHFRSMSYQDVPAFMALLRKLPQTSAPVFPIRCSDCLQVRRSSIRSLDRDRGRPMDHSGRANKDAATAHRASERCSERGIGIGS